MGAGYEGCGRPPGRADVLAVEGFGLSGGDLGGAVRCGTRADPRVRMALEVKAAFDCIDSVG